MGDQEDFCDKARLLDLQNRIVDPRFRDADYPFRVWRSRRKGIMNAFCQSCGMPMKKGRICD